ncbi:MAG: phosphoribosylanthranilate isomerase [Dehalococcoidales bacterium]|nr:phosphoribosylanthranilate isomerase [Dehalococcoidales bacterium]
MTKIKICGIKSEEHAVVAAEAGADFIGLVLAPSPRQVSPATAERIVSAARETEKPVMTVGVFVNNDIDTVRRLSRRCGFDWIQLSGDEPWEYCTELEKPVIKALRISRSRPPEQVLQDITRAQKILRGKQAIILLDTHDKSLYGGTGKTFDWDLAVPIARSFPVIIAGGLTPENVGTLIRQAAPWGVDVSSGVESGGIKDSEKIRKFIEAVRRTDAVS